MTLFADLVELWGAAIWRASWQGGLVALAVWAVCRLVPAIPARFQCWLWRLVIVKFLVALLWGVPIQLPLLPAPEAVAALASEPIPSIPFPAEGVPAAASPAARFVTPWLLIPFVVWIAVALWQAAQILASCRNAQGLRTRCRPSEDRQLLNQLAMLGRSLGRRAPPALLEMDGQGSPLLVGIFRPAIVLPATTLSRLDASERGLVLGHELAHACRRDLLWSVLAAIVRTLFPFHPLAWLSERQLGLAQEIAADELAISLQKRDPVHYATQLVSVVSKLGSGPFVPAMSVGMAGSHRSLQQRLTAMRFMKPVSRPIIVAYAVALAAVAVLGIVPWAPVAAEVKAADPAPVKVPDNKAADKKALEKVPEKPAEKVPEKAQDKAPEKLAESPKQVYRTGRGRLISFQDGKLTLKARDGSTLTYDPLPANAQGMRFDSAAGKLVPGDVIPALSEAKAGTWIQVIVGETSTTIRVGERKQQTIGTFVSFKEGRLMLMLKVVEATSYTKKYGNLVHFNKFFDDTPVHESIDGGEYQLIGTANEVLKNVKEGTIITVHGAGDDNITLVQIGVPKKE